MHHLKPAVQIKPKHFFNMPRHPSSMQWSQVWKSDTGLQEKSCVSSLSVQDLITQFFQNCFWQVGTRLSSPILHFTWLIKYLGLRWLSWGRARRKKKHSIYQLHEYQFQPSHSSVQGSSLSFEAQDHCELAFCRRLGWHLLPGNTAHVGGIVL